VKHKRIPGYASVAPSQACAAEINSILVSQRIACTAGSDKGIASQARERERERERVFIRRHNDSLPERNNARPSMLATKQNNNENYK